MRDICAHQIKICCPSRDSDDHLLRSIAGQPAMSLQVGAKTIPIEINFLVLLCANKHFFVTKGSLPLSKSNVSDTIVFFVTIM